MRSWRVADVVTFLEEADLAGPASSMRTNGVAGADLFSLTADTLTTDLRLTTIAAQKILAARDGFLHRT